MVNDVFNMSNKIDDPSLDELPPRVPGLSVRFKTSEESQGDPPLCNSGSRCEVELTYITNQAQHSECSHRTSLWANRSNEI